MKIPLPGGGFVEPDDGRRDTAFHKRIVRTERLAQFRNGHMIDLECGHRVMTFGNLEHAGGVLLCSQCKAAAT